MSQPTEIFIQRQRGRKTYTNREILMLLDSARRHNADAASIKALAATFRLTPQQLAAVESGTAVVVVVPGTPKRR